MYGWFCMFSLAFTLPNIFNLLCVVMAMLKSNSWRKRGFLALSSPHLSTLFVTPVCVPFLLQCSTLKRNVVLASFFYMLTATTVALCYMSR